RSYPPMYPLPCPLRSCHPPLQRLRSGSKETRPRPSTEAICPGERIQASPRAHAWNEKDQEQVIDLFRFCFRNAANSSEGSGMSLRLWWRWALPDREISLLTGKISRFIREVGASMTSIYVPFMFTSRAAHEGRNASV